ncbi:MAG: PAS domain S-box protein [Nitrospirota bacterium]
MKEIDSYIKSLLDAIGDGILFIDRDYKIVFANQTMLRLFGKKVVDSTLREEEIIGKECYNFFYQFSAPCRSKNPAVVCPHYEVFRTGKKIVTTHKNILPDGTEKIFDITASPHKNEKGEIIHVVEILRDVTEKKEMEENIISLKAFNEEVIERIPVGVHVIDKDFTVRIWNSYFERYTGFKKKDIIGKNLFDVIPGLAAQGWDDEYRRVIETGLPVVKSDYKHVRSMGPRKGEILYQTARIVPLEENSRVVGAVTILEDVTDRKKTEEIIEESEKKLRDIIHGVEEVIYTVDITGDMLHGKLTFVSDQIKDISGYNPEEFIDNPQLWFQTVHPQDISSIIEVTNKVILNKEKGTRLYRIKNNNTGEYRWLEDKIVPQVDDNGKVIGLLGVARDITDRKQAEEMLKESEKKYRQLVDNSIVGIYKTDLKGDIIYVNKAMSDLLEFDSPEDMMKGGVLTRYKNPKDRENLIERLMKTGFVSNFEVDILTKSGKTLNVILSASIERDIISGMMIDVSEQRHAEKAVKDSEIFLSSILEGIRDGVVVLDRDFRVLYANKTYSEQIGTSFDVKGKHCYSISYSREEPCYLSGLECSVKKVFETGLVSREIRKKFDKHMEMTVYPLKDFSGNVLAVVEIRRDVTRSEQLDEELKNRIRELEEFYDIAVGREMRMRELKKEMGELKEELKKGSA